MLGKSDLEMGQRGYASIIITLVVIAGVAGVGYYVWSKLYENRDTDIPPPVYDDITDASEKYFIDSLDIAVKIYNPTQYRLQPEGEIKVNDVITDKRLSSATFYSFSYWSGKFPYKGDVEIEIKRNNEIIAQRDWSYEANLEKWSTTFTVEHTFRNILIGEEPGNFTVVAKLYDLSEPANLEDIVEVVETT